MNQYFLHTLSVKGRVIFQIKYSRFNLESIRSFADYFSDFSIPQWLSFEDYKTVVRSLHILKCKRSAEYLIGLNDNIVFSVRGI